MTYIHTPLLIVTCFFATHIQAQKIYVVADARNKKPIAYATVQTSTSYIATNDDGQFSKNIFKNGDTLNISCVGYDNLKLPLQQLKDTIYLHPKTNTMQEIIVKANMPEKTIKNYKTLETVPIHMLGDAAGMIKASMLPFPKEENGNTKKITKVTLKIKMQEDSNPCRLHLYDVAADGKPGNELLNESIIITAKNIRNRTCTIDVSAKQVLTKSDGIFIGVEFIGEVFTINGSLARDTTKNVNIAVVYGTTKYPHSYMYFKRSQYEGADWIHMKLPGDEYHNMKVAVSYQ